MVTALVAAIPARADGLQALVDRLAAQTMKVDRLLLALDGAWGKPPPLRAPFDLIPHLRGGTLGAGQRFRHPGLLLLDPNEPVLVIDDDVVPAPDYVARSMSARGASGIVSWYGFSYDGLRVGFEDAPGQDQIVDYFSIGTMLVDAGSLVRWAFQREAAPFLGPGGYDQLYISLCAWREKRPATRPAGAAPLSWSARAEQGSWIVHSPTWRGQRRAIADATGFAPNVDRAHAGLPRDLAREEAVYAASMSALVARLNLGCAERIEPGWTNVDLVPGPGVDLACDLRDAWPWDDGTVHEIRAFDVIEHLPDKIHTMNEMWRVLRHNGIAHVLVPTTDGRGAFQDPTHVSYWNRNSFWYYEAGNPHRERFKDSYGIRAAFAVVEESLRRMPNEIVMLDIRLRAIKPRA